MRTLISAVCALILSSPVLAQQDQVTTTAVSRSGFWFDVGIGAGSLNAKASAGGQSESDTEMGFSGNLGLGGTLSPNVQVGVGTFGWYKDPGTMGNLMGIVNFFPAKEGNLWIRGGVGYYVYRESDSGFGDFELMGFSGAVGVGYDFMVSRTLGIAPYASFVFGASSEIKLDGVDTGVDGSLTVFQIGGMLSIN